MTIGQMASLSNSRIAGVVTCCPTRRIDADFFYDRFTKEEVANTQKISGVAHRYWVDHSQSSLGGATPNHRLELAGRRD
jgi:3-oxoacyl-[acyl-carrier-protein] synthase-3